METISNINADKIKEFAIDRMGFKSEGLAAMLDYFKDNEAPDDQAIKLLTVTALFELVNEMRITRKLVEESIKVAVKKPVRYRGK